MIVEERRGILTEDVDASEDLFQRLVLEAEACDAPSAQGLHQTQSACDVQSFSFMGQLEDNFSLELHAASSRQDIATALSARITNFIKHTENACVSHALRMALINHVWKKKKKKRCAGEEQEESVMI